MQNKLLDGHSRRKRSKDSRTAAAGSHKRILVSPDRNKALARNEALDGMVASFAAGKVQQANSSHATAREASQHREAATSFSLSNSSRQTQLQGHGFTTTNAASTMGLAEKVLSALHRQLPWVMRATKLKGLYKISTLSNSKAFKSFLEVRACAASQLIILRAHGRMPISYANLGSRQ